MKNFIIPELGENISSATIVKILIKTGDIVATDQPVLELETDKATIEVPSDVSGKVVAINVAEGESVSIGQVIFSVESAESTETTQQAKAEPAAEEKQAVAPPQPEAQPVEAPQPTVVAASSVQEFKLPELGENISKATIIKVMVAVGEKVSADQSVLELETDKATIEVPSTVSGTITEILVAEGDVIEIGAAD